MMRNANARNDLKIRKLSLIVSERPPSTKMNNDRPFSVVYLTNQKWFSVVYSLIDNDTRHHSGQNVVDSRGAAA